VLPLWLRNARVPALFLLGAFASLEDDLGHVLVRTANTDDLVIFEDLFAFLVSDKSPMNSSSTAQSENRVGLYAPVEIGRPKAEAAAPVRPCGESATACRREGKPVYRRSFRLRGSCTPYMEYFGAA